MVEIATSSCDKVSTKDVFTGSYGFLERGSRVVNLFSRSKKDSGKCNAPSEISLDSDPVLAPELVSLLARNSLPHLRETFDLGCSRKSTDVFACQDGFDLDMALSRHESESSRELIYKTPAEFASTCTLSSTSPNLRLQEFERELAELKAARTRQRSALRQQVLSEVDIPAKAESVSTPSASILVPISEQDDRSSLSSRSSEENLTFQDATDDFEDEESRTDPDDSKKTNNSKSVDFSFLHSVCRTKGKHEEAILLRMKYAGNTGLRTDEDGIPNTDSSNSILGTGPPPRTETKLMKEYAHIIRETLRKCEAGGKTYRHYERPAEHDLPSVTTSGSTTPRQRSDHSSTQTSSKTSVEADIETTSRGISLLQTQPRSLSPSEQSSPSVSRSASPPPENPQSKPIPQISPSQSFDEYPRSELPSLVLQHDFQESPGSQPSKCSRQPSKSSQDTGNLTSPTAQQQVTYNRDFRDCDVESSQSYGRPNSTSDAGTEEDWPSAARSDTSDRSPRGKHPVEIPITIDGRIVYPEVIFAEDNRTSQTSQTSGPLGLLDRVRSFAKTCGPHDKETLREKSPETSTFPEGVTLEGEGEKASATLNSALLSRLICVECGLFCTPPVAMCMWGHIVCEECRPIGLWENHGNCWCRKRCPQCAGDMMSRPCELWTNIARSLLYPCRFTSNGCREIQGLTPTEKVLHEETCRWRQLRCWCPGCSWRGIWCQMRAHVIKVHLPKATRADWYRFVTVNGAPSIGRSSDVIALPANELVVLHSLSVIGEHRYLLQYLSDDGGGAAVLFVPRFKLRLVSTDGKSEVEVRGQAVPVQQDVERALRSGRCFRLSGTPFGREVTDDTMAPESVTVQVCLEKGRLSFL